MDAMKKKVKVAELNRKILSASMNTQALKTI